MYRICSRLLTYQHLPNTILRNATKTKPVRYYATSPLPSSSPSSPSSPSPKPNPGFFQSLAIAFNEIFSTKKDAATSSGGSATTTTTTAAAASSSSSSTSSESKDTTRVLMYLAGGERVQLANLNTEIARISRFLDATNLGLTIKDVANGKSVTWPSKAAAAATATVASAPASAVPASEVPASPTATEATETATVASTPAAAVPASEVSASPTATEATEAATATTAATPTITTTTPSTDVTPSSPSSSSSSSPSLPSSLSSTATTTTTTEIPTPTTPTEAPTPTAIAAEEAAATPTAATATPTAAAAATAPVVADELTVAADTLVRKPPVVCVIENKQHCLALVVDGETKATVNWGDSAESVLAFLNKSEAALDSSLGTEMAAVAMETLANLAKIRYPYCFPPAATASPEEFKDYIFRLVREQPREFLRRKLDEILPLLRGAEKAVQAQVGTAGLGSKDNPLYMRQTPGTLWDWIFRHILTIILIVVIVLSVRANSGGGGGIGSILGMTQSKHSELILSDKTFDDVKGCEEAKADMIDVVDYLRHPEIYHQRDIQMPKGVLFIGPPGTGKTLLARALAGEAGVKFLYCNASEFDEMFVGVGASRMRNMFEMARKNAPCIIFIDEFDAVASKRSAKSMGSRHENQSLNQLLAELDGFKPTEGVLVVAATNLPDVLDPAAIRPGRFDRRVFLSLPERKARTEILELYTKKKKLAKDVDLAAIAARTPGCTGADLNNLVNWAAIEAAKEGSKEITMAHMENAKENILMGRERRSLIITEKGRKTTAYHEAGHALVGLLTPNSPNIYKATLVPRANALGMVSWVPDEGKYNETLGEALAAIDVAMGGRAAEELIFGHNNITSGASSDFKQANRVARSMVEKWGMSQSTGLLTPDEHMSEATLAEIDKEVKKILDDSFKRAHGLLKTHNKELELLAQALIEYETLFVEEIREVIAGRSIDKKTRESLEQEREKRKEEDKRERAAQIEERENKKKFLEESERKLREKAAKPPAEAEPRTTAIKN